MKIQYCSDLHLEFPRNRIFLEQHPIKPMGEVLILAGDILPLILHKKQSIFIDYVSDNFEMVYWVPGNHEYYGYDLATVPDPLLEKLRPNVWLVNNQVVFYNDISFICTTLWSKINAVNEVAIQRSISDFFSIKWQGKKFTAHHFNELHNHSIAFLQNAINDNRTSKSIVLTHHVPTKYQYPAQYQNSPVNDAFVTELYDIVHDSGAAFWIYGHHHCNIPPFVVGSTTVLTNQLGYVENNEQVGFERDACIVV